MESNITYYNDLNKEFEKTTFEFKDLMKVILDIYNNYKIEEMAKQKILKHLDIQYNKITKTISELDELNKIKINNVFDVDYNFKTNNEDESIDDFLNNIESYLDIQSNNKIKILFNAFKNKIHRSLENIAESDNKKIIFNDVFKLDILYLYCMDRYPVGMYTGYNGENKLLLNINEIKTNLPEPKQQIHIYNEIVKIPKNMLHDVMGQGDVDEISEKLNMNFKLFHVFLKKKIEFNNTMLKLQQVLTIKQKITSFMNDIFKNYLFSSKSIKRVVYFSYNSKLYFLDVIDKYIKTTKTNTFIFEFVKSFISKIKLNERQYIDVKSLDNNAQFNFLLYDLINEFYLKYFVNSKTIITYKLNKNMNVQADYTFNNIYQIPYYIRLNDYLFDYNQNVLYITLNDSKFIKYIHLFLENKIKEFIAFEVIGNDFDYNNYENCILKVKQFHLDGSINVLKTINDIKFDIVDTSRLADATQHKVIRSFDQIEKELKDDTKNVKDDTKKTANSESNEKGFVVYKFKFINDSTLNVIQFSNAEELNLPIKNKIYSNLILSNPFFIPLISMNFSNQMLKQFNELNNDKLINKLFEQVICKDKNNKDVTIKDVFNFTMLNNNKFDLNESNLFVDQDPNKYDEKIFNLYFNDPFKKTKSRVIILYNLSLIYSESNNIIMDVFMNSIDKMDASKSKHLSSLGLTDKVKFKNTLRGSFYQSFINKTMESILKNLKTKTSEVNNKTIENMFDYLKNIAKDNQLITNIENIAPYESTNNYSNVLSVLDIKADRYVIQI